MDWNQCQTTFLRLIFHILSLFQNFEIRRKIVKNRGFTSLLFFDLENSSQFYLKMTEINAKLLSFG